MLSSVIFNLLFIFPLACAAGCGGRRRVKVSITDSGSFSWPSENPRPESMRPSGAEVTPPADAQPSETQLDFFHKLGYSTAQVQAVQQQLGSPSMDTDKVLGELVKVGQHHPVTTMSVLVARGDVKAAGPTVQLPVGTTAHPLAAGSSEESGEDEDALRPVVIDGSNVAMR